MDEFNNMVKLTAKFRLHLQRLRDILREQPEAARKMLLLVSCVCVAITSSLQVQAYFALKDAQRQKDEVAQALFELQRTAGDGAKRTNFLQKLPTTLDATGVTSKIQKQINLHGVSLSSLTVREHALSAKALAHLEWDLNLKGTYPQIKSALAEILVQAPDVRIQTLKLKSSSPSALDAQVSLVMWRNPMAPLPAQSAR